MSGGIWIADSNLFRPPYSRRLLFGLSAYLDEPLAVVPSLTDFREVPSMLAYGVAADQRLTESEPLLTGLHETMCVWLDREIEKGELFALHRLPADHDPLRHWGKLQSMFRRDADNKYSRDLDIVAEAVAVDAEFIATNNLYSIDHSALNQWARTRLGRNSDLIGTADDLVKRLVGDERVVAEIIAGMSVATAADRSNSVEVASIHRFLDSLGTTGWRETSFKVANHMHRLDEHGVEAIIVQARGLSKTPAFMAARHAEERLQGIYADGLDMACQRGEVGALSNAEGAFIEKYGGQTPDYIGH